MKKKLVEFVSCNLWGVYFDSLGFRKLIDNCIKFETDYLCSELTIRLKIFGINIFGMYLCFDEDYSKRGKSYRKSAYISFILLNFMFELRILSKKLFGVT